MQRENAKVSYNPLTMLTRHRLEFIGWGDGDLPDPGKMNTAAPLTKLIASLEAGTCGWKAVADDDYEERRTSIIERAEAAGIVLDAPRQQRKDAGSTRGKKRSPLGAVDTNSIDTT